MMMMMMMICQGPTFSTKDNHQSYMYFIKSTPNECVTHIFFSK